MLLIVHIDVNYVGVAVVVVLEYCLFFSITALALGLTLVLSLVNVLVVATL
jgi:hypothetical protein